MSILAQYLQGKTSGQIARGEIPNPMLAMGGPAGIGGGAMAAMAGAPRSADDSSMGVAQGGGGDLPELMKIAETNLGMNERDQNAALQDFLKNGGVNLDPATTAWCAAFVNATLKQGGLEGTGSNLARSFETWGEGVDEPQRGDLAVFWRESLESGKGHVGFFDGYNEDGTIRVLGGNQGDSVSYSNYSPDQLIGFRRAPKNPMMAMAGM